MAEQLLPCYHLNQAKEICELGKHFPKDCSKNQSQIDCAAYEPMLKDTDRTKCEVWTRVMGYHRPTWAFNTGKRSEHEERRYFNESSGAHHERPDPN